MPKTMNQVMLGQPFAEKSNRCIYAYRAGAATLYYNTVWEDYIGRGGSSPLTGRRNLDMRRSTRRPRIAATVRRARPRPRRKACRDEPGPAADVGKAPRRPRRNLRETELR